MISLGVIMKEIKKYLQSRITDKDICVLALSGGPDSMCLLSLLEEINAHIICVHINHNTRAACIEEYAFIKKYVEQKKIPLVYHKIEKYTKGKFTEEEAREIRYQKLLSVANKYHAKYILTAHHADDLTETIIMRLLRGSTLEGYAGFKKETTYQGHIILRPLISKKKQEIYAYLKANEIPYIEDESNKSDDYERNRIRHHILPLLERENDKYPTKILQFSNTLLKKATLLKEVMDDERKKIEENGKINVSLFKKLSPLMQESYVEYYLQDVYQENLKKITLKHQRLFLKSIENKETRLILDFPGGYQLVKENGYIYLAKKKESVSYCIKCEDMNILPNGILKKIENYEEKSNYEIHLNSQEIALPLYITTRKNGMKMATKNLKGHQKISDILTNSKIKGSKKDEIPILVDSKGEVLWVLGIKKSKYDLEKDKNYDIIYKYIERKEKTI